MDNTSAIELRIGDLIAFKPTGYHTEVKELAQALLNLRQAEYWRKSTELLTEEIDDGSDSEE